MTRIPEPPPGIELYLQSLADGEKPGVMLETIQKIHSHTVGPVDTKARYLHWDKLKYIEPPEGYTPDLYWHAMKASRAAIRRDLPFVDKHEARFWFCMPDPLLAQVMWISEQASGTLVGEPALTDDKAKQRHIINSLTDEAIYSSQLEGASTTRAVAREMIRTERKPMDVSEQMILNNYRAMMFIKEHVDDNITPAMIFALQTILVESTDIPADRIGVFRKAEDNVVIEDHMTGELLHAPPKVEELSWRMAWLCNFINGNVDTAAHAISEGAFLPPVLRAIIAHFVVGYDHPFFDGNGRTARALFYWVMAREGFWLMEHLSISAEIKKSPASYSKAYLHVETDEGDVTYFLMHQLDIVTRAIDGLKERLREKNAEVKETEKLLDNSTLAGKLNHRQLVLLQNALKNPGQTYTVKSHQNSHRVARQTARNDLVELVDKYGLLVGGIQGRTAIFTAPADLLERIHGQC
ncbi:MAG: Fic family protein [Gammaproteobacteria bacterium]|nr:MAG: Fic family protein [Gammaproteobacteria bacterium]RLA57505.1 MAG: Fic family protein [Gammaproteobacteria bacterium]